MAESTNINNKTNVNDGNNANNNRNSNNGKSNRNNHGGRNNHRNSNSGGADNITKFTLGNCEEEGKKHEFRYDNGTYTIVLLKDEENFDVVLKTKDKDEAYEEWNKIKRPGKKK